MDWARLFGNMRLALLVGVLVATLAAPAAHADLLSGLDRNCGATSQPFAGFGDPRLYTFGRNGGLENGSTGWSLSGSSVVDGNEAFYAHSAQDDSSLSLPAGSSALTPPLCMGTTSTVLRFFVRSPEPGSLRVQVVLRNTLGNVLGIIDVSRVSAGRDWQPGPSILNLDSLLGLLGVSSVQLKLTSLSGTHQVDDVYVDPWESRGA